MSEGNKKNKPVDSNTLKWQEKQNKKNKEEQEPKEKKKKEKEKKQVKEQPKVQTKPEPQEQIKKQVKYIKTIQNTLIVKYPQLKQNRKQQLGILNKAKNNLIHEQDTIIYIGDSASEVNCSIVSIPGFCKVDTAEIICRYEDVAVLLEDTVRKVFVDGFVIFGNGNILAKKGSLNIVLLARYYGRQVIGVAGSWNYCGDAPISELELEDKYGEKVMEEYDLIEGKMLSCIVMESGSVIAAQVPYYISQGYKNTGIEMISW